MTDRIHNTSSWKADDIARIKQLISEGVSVLDEAEELKSSLAETVGAISEELGIKKSQLNRAIKLARSGNYRQEEDSLTEVSDLLSAAGYS